MNILEALNFMDLNHDNALGFVKTIRDLEIEQKLNSDATKEFLSAADNFSSLHELLSEKPSTKEIEKYDSYADNEWRALYFQLMANLVQNHDMDLRKASSEVRKVFTKFSDPTNLPYKKEYDVLDKLITELDALTEPVLTQARVIDIVNGLRKRVEDFKKAFYENIIPEDANMLEMSKAARSNLNIAWDRLVRYLESQIAANPKDSNLQALSKKFNEAIITIKKNAGGFQP